MESRPAHMPATSLVDRLMDNSNRRQYGMGIVGRMTRFLFVLLFLRPRLPQASILSKDVMNAG